MKKWGLLVVALFSVAILAMGCTATHYTKPVKSPILVTTGGVDRNYESLGYVQVDKMGITVLGLIPIATADIDEVLRDLLVKAAKKKGADAVINVSYVQTPLFCLPFRPPSPIAHATGELIKFR